MSNFLPFRNIFDFMKPRQKPLTAHVHEVASFNPSDLPDGADEYLDARSAKLEELHRRYAAFASDATLTIDDQWTTNYIRDEEIKYFRGDNGYVWQLRGKNMKSVNYTLTTYYIMAMDSLRLLDRLEEDGAFGNFTFKIAGKVISRDLIDSVVELYFLERHLGLSTRDSVRVLDIGAGYGRLAHRAVAAFPKLAYLCTDAFPVSSLISDYYLNFRGLTDRARAVPLDEIETVLKLEQVDVAVNIHSFSECRIEAINWWLALISKYKVRYLMIVPNTNDGDGSRLCTDDLQEMQPLIEQHHYKLIARDPKYLDPAVQADGINPTYHFLFELMAPQR